MYAGKRYRDAGRKSLEEEAKERGLKPASLYGLGDDAIRSSIPLLATIGSHVPDGYEMVSASNAFLGIGPPTSLLTVRTIGTPTRRNEITAAQFAYLARSRPGYSYAVVKKEGHSYDIGVYRATALRDIARESRAAATI
jgi:hypothetical protein